VDASSVSAPGRVHYDHGLILVDRRGKRSVRCTRKRTLFHSIACVWNEISSIMNHYQMETPGWGISRGNADPSTRSSCNC